MSIPAAAAPPVHPAWIRIPHWLNALAVFVMMTSGWRIYNASPLFDFSFPRGVTLGGWLGGALQWHFAAMWLLAANGLAYLVLNLTTGRLRRRFFPLSLRAAATDAGAALRGRLSHDDPRRYNAVQRLAYVFAMADVAALALSGLAIWKPVQLGTLCALMGGYESARHVHFFAMALLAGFIALHVAMALLVPRSIRAMILGK
ncbi:cytochrome b/b6 domain-containing protein [Achromobacter sp. Marseille-Q4962]|uniref:cytochrome b/b6 domain-containing protein n=1 Tax=Achromobacter sp. Marseille-Q4962 TaxID=2942202 RepID=UPI0020739D11|nr:cytochrome b/b6 domain-containing protein [Achromobacter sp. Marseille-Q4962]